MKKKRFAVTQIVAVPKEAEAGMPVVELIRRIGITEQTLPLEETICRSGQRSGKTA